MAIVIVPPVDWLNQRMHIELKDIVGPIIGGFVACFFAVILRSYQEWQTYQEEMGLIRERFDCLPDEHLETVCDAYRKSVEDVTKTICRVRPYLLPRHRSRLTKLLDMYRSAGKSRDSGFDGNPPVPPDYADCLPDPKKARSYLANILDQMTKARFLCQ